MERETLLQSTSEGLWRAVESSWPEIVIKNKNRLTRQEKVNACIVFCPLYKTGDLKSSDILDLGQDIGESRVAGKVNAYERVLSSLSRALEVEGKSLKVSFVVANKGVILERNSTKEDIEKLEYHNSLYCELVGRWADKYMFEYDFSDYFQKEIDHPVFVNINKDIPSISKQQSSESKSEPFLLIEYMNKFIRPDTPITNNADNRHVAKSLIKAFGMNGAFWLTTGYLVFDHRIPKITGEDGIYLVSERFDPLFAISKFTPELDKLTRIQIKA